MINFQNIGQYLQLLEKGFFVLGSLIYLVFAIVIIKQTTVMTKNVHDKFNPILIVFSFLHLAFSLLLVFLTITLL